MRGWIAIRRRTTARSDVLGDGRMGVFAPGSADNSLGFAEPGQRPGVPLERRIRRFVALILGLNVVALILVQTSILEPSVERLERSLLYDDLHRVENAIEQEAKSLDLKCREWSAWDDPYEVILKPGSPELARFVADNLVDEYFAVGQIALMGMIDRSGKVVWGEVHGPDGRLVEKLDGLREFFDRDPSAIFDFKDPTDQYTGVVGTRLGPMIVASRPQLNGKFEGPIRGAFIMGKFLDGRLTARLSDQTRVLFRRWNSRSGSGAGGIPATLRAGERNFAVRDSQTIDAYTAIADDRGETVFVAHAIIPRTVQLQAERFFQLMHGSVIAVSAAVFLALGFVLRRHVVHPIVGMKGSMQSLAESKEITGRIAREDPTEIGLLAGDIHRLLERTARDMNFMRMTEDALRRNEHILRLMAERTPSGFLLVDAAGGRVLYHNRLFCEIWAGAAYDAEANLCDPTLPELRERVCAALRDAPVAHLFADTLLDPGDSRVIDDEWVLTDGRTVRTYSTLLQSGDGVVIGRYYVFDDITAQKRVEADLVRRGLLLEAVATASNLLISSSDHAAAMSDALAVLGTAIEAGRVEVVEIPRTAAASKPALELRHRWTAHDENAEAGERTWWGPMSAPALREMIDALSDGRVIHVGVGEVSSENPDTRAILVPVHVDAHLWGCVRFELLRAPATRTEEDDSILLVAAGSIGADIARKAYEKKLVETVSELERMNRLMRGRENRVLELKAVINELHVRLGERPRYTVPESYYGAEERRVS